MAFAGQDFPDTNIGEAPDFAFNWATAPWFAPSETILTAVFTCALVSGSDPSPNSHIVGPAGISNFVTTQKVDFTDPNATQSGNVYRLQCTITTSLGQTLVLYAHTNVLAPS